MRTHKRVPRKNLMTPAQVREERRINPWLSLAQGVILQAIFDWRALEADVKIVGGAKTTFDGLRAFFRSQWADHLLLCTDISALYVLDVLENELAEIEAGRTQVLPRVNARPTVVRRAKPKSAAALDDLKQWTNDKPTRRKA